MITTRKEVEEAIELSHFTKNLIGPRQIAEDVLPQLSDELKHQWLIERLMRILKRKLNQWKAPPKEQAQLNLPGFESLPRRIVFRDGRWKLFDKATILQVREGLELFRIRSSDLRIIKQIEAALELMQKYTSIYPRITWGKVKELEGKSRLS